MSSTQRWLIGSSMGGLLIWLGLFVRWWQGPPDLLATVTLLLLLAILVNTPLALSLVPVAEGQSIWFRWALRLQPFAAVGVVWSMMSAQGGATAVLALPWLLFAGLLATSGLWQLRHWSQLTNPARTRLAALLYLPIGAAWLVAYRFGWQPLGFAGVIVLLTAVHFHFTGFAAPIWVSLIGTMLPHASARYAWAAGGFVAATPLIAIGITLSPLLEMAGVVLLAASLVGLTLLLYRAVLPAVLDPLAKCLLAVAPLAMLVALSLAVIYAIGEYRQVQLLTIGQMVQWHGWLNALGFVFCGLWGWRLALDRKRQSLPNGLPAQWSQR